MKNVGRYGNSAWAGGVDDGYNRRRAHARTRFDGWSYGQRFSGNDFNPRTDAGIYPENYRRVRRDFNFRTVDAKHNGRIFHGDFYKYTCAAKLRICDFD